MAVIKFPSRGKEHTMLVDDEDVPLCEYLNIHLINTGYAQTSISGNKLKTVNEMTGLDLKPKYGKNTNRVNTKALIHRLIMRVTDPKIQVDHINGNPLDNRKENLRLVTDQQNSCNVRKHKDNKSGYKGVCLKRKKWVAEIMKKGVKKCLGYFDDPIEAARAYDRAALELHGEFAYTNFPKEDYNV